MIIAYYPGAGGNKYYNKIKGAPWQTHQKSYDNEIYDQLEKHRYVFQNSLVDNHADYILTHCVNTVLLNKLWPGREIHVIQSDLQSCLRREWMLSGHRLYLEKIEHEKINLLEFYAAIRDPSWPDIGDETEIDDLPQRITQEFYQRLQELQSPTDPVQILKNKYFKMIDSAVSSIQWHKDYYASLPMDLAYCSRTVSMTDHSAFAMHMQKELRFYQNQIFDECWEICHE